MRHDTIETIDGHQTLGIFGAGGHGRELAWIAAQCGWASRRLRFVLDREYLRTPQIDGVEVLDTADFSRRFPASPILVGVGDPKARFGAVARLRAQGHWFPALISPRACVAPSAEWEEGFIAFPGALIGVGTRFGEHAHINANCSISHDVSIGAYSSLSPGVNACGGARVGRMVFVGANACLINSTATREIDIGDSAFIAAGACVTERAPAGVKVAGVPAREIRRTLPCLP